MTGEVRFTPEHLAGVFEPLKDPAYFRQVLVDHGAVGKQRGKKRGRESFRYS
jgi:hypothetical protein